MRYLLLLICVALPLSACAHKGKLKSPSQIAYDQEKKEQKAEKRSREAEEERSAKMENPSVEPFYQPTPSGVLHTPPQTYDPVDAARDPDGVE